MYLVAPDSIHVRPNVSIPYKVSYWSPARCPYPRPHRLCRIGLRPVEWKVCVTINDPVWLSVCNRRVRFAENLYHYRGVLFWKKRAEEALQRSGLDYTIVRPGESSLLRYYWKI